MNDEQPDSIEHDIECPDCRGYGDDWGYGDGRPRTDCERCDGSGRVALPLDPKDMP